jgi:hypothetical protein
MVQRHAANWGKGNNSTVLKRQGSNFDDLAAGQSLGYEWLFVEAGARATTR